jgi:ring-1,2-phenylacetyl-CoA epoxidase subunit PaaC
MMAGETAGQTAGETASDQAPARGATRDLVLALADTKRLLGYRYAEWMLGAPELETGIACSSMAQDEWGHARLLYALLREFGDDPERLEHGREGHEYHSMEVLDSGAATWPDLVALMALADEAITTQIEALRGSSHESLRQRVEKVLEEEKFHSAHGAAWFRRLAGGSDASRAALTDAVDRVLDSVVAWFGPGSERAHALEGAGVVDAAGPALAARYLARVAPLLEMVERQAQSGRAEPGPEFDESRRRGRSGGPDAETIRKIRGDRNRAFLMD